MIRLPKKITPAKIRESIVQVYFGSEIPFEPLVGYLFSILNTGFGLEYLNRPLPPLRQLAVDRINQPEKVELMVGPRHFFFNEEIKIQLQPGGSLVFNCVDEYLGWTQYSDYIRRVLAKLSDSGIITQYYRVGVRYISEFANVDILDKVNFSVNSSVLNSAPMSGSFRVEWKDDPYRIILNLGTKLAQQPVLQHEVENVEFVSLIDIDIIHEHLEQPKFNHFWETVEKAHLKEKEIFFTLLRQDFLETLNPEYE